MFAGKNKDAFSTEIDAIIAPIKKIVAKLDALVERKQAANKAAQERREALDLEIANNDIVASRAITLGSRYRELLGETKSFSETIAAE
jgi:hypothetical protein